MGEGFRREWTRQLLGRTMMGLRRRLGEGSLFGAGLCRPVRMLRRRRFVSVAVIELE